MCLFSLFGKNAVKMSVKHDEGSSFSHFLVSHQIHHSPLPQCERCNDPVDGRILTLIMKIPAGYTILLTAENERCVLCPGVGALCVVAVMAAHSNNFIRVRLYFDYPPPAVVDCRMCWLLVDLNTCRVVADLESLIREKFEFSRRSILSLFIEDCYMPHTECIYVVRDNDSIRCACLYCKFCQETLWSWIRAVSLFHKLISSHVYS